MQEYKNNIQTKANKFTAAMKLDKAGFRKRKVPSEREISQDDKKFNYLSTYGHQRSICS